MAVVPGISGEKTHATASAAQLTGPLLVAATWPEVEEDENPAVWPWLQWNHTPNRKTDSNCPFYLLQPASWVVKTMFASLVVVFLMLLPRLRIALARKFLQHPNYSISARMRKNTGENGKKWDWYSSPLVPSCLTKGWWLCQAFCLALEVQRKQITCMHSWISLSRTLGSRLSADRLSKVGTGNDSFKRINF